MTFGGIGTTGVLLQWNSMVTLIHTFFPIPLPTKEKKKKRTNEKMAEIKIKIEKRAHNELFLFSHH